MKKRAVEWLQDEMLNGKLNMKEILEHAKEMEKQQIIDAVNSQRQLGWDEKGEQYYNETFKNK